MSTIKALLSNTKVQAMLANALALAVGHFGLNLSPVEIAVAMATLSSLVVGHAVDKQAAGSVALEINDAAPSGLDPDARLTALEQWVREHAAASGVPVPQRPTAGPPPLPKP